MRRRRPATGRDHGFVTAWTLALSVTCWMLVGLVLDSGRVLRARSEAFGAAAAAARSGTQALDERVAVAEGRFALDREAARAAAAGYLHDHGLSGSVQVDDLAVTVTVTDSTDLGILPGSISFRISATSQAIDGSPP